MLHKQTNIESDYFFFNVMTDCSQTHSDFARGYWLKI